MAIELTTLSLSQLASLYNLIADKQVSKFKDKPTGVAKLGKLLDQTNQEVFLADGEYDIRPIPAEVDPHAASNKMIADAMANNPEFAAMVKVDGKKKQGRKSSLLGKKLELVREKNPKRDNSRTKVRYELYREVKTSDEFIRLCEERKLGSRREILSDLAYDSEQEFIRLS